MHNLIKAVFIFLLIVAFFVGANQVSNGFQSDAETIKKQEIEVPKADSELKIAVNVDSEQEKPMKTQPIVEKIESKPKEVTPVVKSEKIEESVSPTVAEVEIKDTKHEEVPEKVLGNTGELQDGEILPSLKLDAMNESLIKSLIFQRKAYLVVNLGNNRYLIQTNEHSTFENITVSQLSNAADLSQRYITLSRQQIRPEELDDLDNQVYNRTKIEIQPVYNLVFSKEYSAYITSVQLKKLEEQNIDKNQLKTKKKHIHMQGFIGDDFSLKILNSSED